MTRTQVRGTDPRDPKFAPLVEFVAICIILFMLSLVMLATVRGCLADGGPHPCPMDDRADNERRDSR